MFDPAGLNASMRGRVWPPVTNINLDNEVDTPYDCGVAGFPKLEVLAWRSSEQIVSEVWYLLVSSAGSIDRRFDSTAAG